MSTLSPQMSLVLPTIGVDSGLFWEQSFLSDMSIIDGHNHSPGFGAPINTAAISVNSDFPFNSFNATLLRSARFSSQISPISDAADLGCLYVSGVDLYYNDGNGNQIQITSGAAVNATASGISSGTATASFVASVLTVLSAVNTPASIKGGSLLLGNTGVTGSHYLTLSPPSALASNYGLTLPAIPSQLNIMMLDTSGNMSAPLNVDGSTIVISSNTLLVPANGITSTQIAGGNVGTVQLASSAVTTAKIADQNVTLAKQALVTQIISSTCGTSATSSVTFSQVTNFSFGITLIGGRTVDIFIVPDGSATEGRIVMDSGTLPVPNARGFIQLKRNGGVIGFTTLSMNGFGGSVPIEISMAGNLRFIDTGASAGANTYSLEFCVDSGSTVLTFINLKMIAREV